jgi:hypothetical protein
MVKISENSSLLFRDGAAAMTNIVLRVISAILIGVGVLIIAVSSGFFMNLLGAGIVGAGGATTYLILSHWAQKHSVG